MKNKNRVQLNIMLNEEDKATINALREKYGINISGTTKRLLRQYLLQLEKAKLTL